MKNFDYTTNQSVAGSYPYPLLSSGDDLPEFHSNNIPFLTNISENAIADLMRTTKTINYIRKEILVPEDRKNNALMVIFTGRLWVYRGNDEKTKNVTFQVHEPRSGSGEIAVLSDELRSASVVALERTMFALVSKDDLGDWLTAYPEMKLTLLGLTREGLDS